jgi:Zn-dependent membrane protease YugP
VELNASSRAVAQLQSNDFILPKEMKGVKKVLSAAALTYVAAVVAAVLNLLRLVLISRIFGDD